VTRRILHASDFSPASAPAFARAVALAKAKHAELCLLHVLDPTMPVTDGVVSPPTYAALLKSARAYARKGLARLVARAVEAGVRATPVLREGSAWSEIARASRARGVDLVVIGTHGRSGVSRLLLGSVASRVVGLARCPVLAVGARAGGKRS
jgi:nucleotide-binding universal stress UspA family protein